MPLNQACERHSHNHPVLATLQNEVVIAELPLQHARLLAEKVCHCNSQSLRLINPELFLERRTVPFPDGHECRESGLLELEEGGFVGILEEPDVPVEAGLAFLFDDLGLLSLLDDGGLLFLDD